MQFRTLYRVVLSSSLISLSGCHLQKGAIHRVEEGDTLVQVSHLYGVEIVDILAANHLKDPSNLRIGETIYIPTLEETSKEKIKLDNLEETVEVGDVPLPTQSSRKETPKAKIEVTPTPAVSPNKPGKVLKTDFVWPAKGVIVWPFGMRRNKMHNGIDIRVEPGSAIRAALDGEVAYHGHGVTGYGDLVILKHPGHLFTVYAYLGQIQVEKGKVSKGDVIAKARTELNSSFFHFEVRQGKVALDPNKLLPKTH